MKILLGERRSGKSTRLVEWFGEDPKNRLIVVPNRPHADEVTNLVCGRVGMVYRHSVVWSRDEVHRAIQRHRVQGDFRGQDLRLGIDEGNWADLSEFAGHVDIITMSLPRGVTASDALEVEVLNLVRVGR